MGRAANRSLVSLGAIVVAAGAAGTAPAAGSSSSASPGNAAIASELGVTPAPVAPYRPGDLVWTTSPPVAQLVPFGSSCQRVPSSGYIGHDVYAQTTGEYSSSWSWSAASSHEAFHWYVFNAGGSLEADDYSGGGSGSISVPANVNDWKVQNLGADPQAWTACWSG